MDMELLMYLLVFLVVATRFLKTQDHGNKK